MRRQPVYRQIILLLLIMVAQTYAQKVGDKTTMQEKGYEVMEIRDRLFYLSDGAYNTMFLVSSEGVIVVDPLPTLGVKYLQAIEEVTDKPVTHIVYSHEHTDHIGAASLFPKNAVIIAHRETAELLRRRNDPRRPVPTVTFDKNYTLKVGDQTLELYYRGVNHEAGNIFIYAPRQKALMLVDVIYPGYMPYPNLGVAVDIPGYVQAHRDALSYDFKELVGGHVSRLGTRRDVEVSLEFVSELRVVVGQKIAALPFPAYLKTHQGKEKWLLHDDYERDLTEKCYADLLPKWGKRLIGAENFLRSHCWTMIVAEVIQSAPEKTSQ